MFLLCQRLCLTVFVPVHLASKSLLTCKVMVAMQLRSGRAQPGMVVICLQGQLFIMMLFFLRRDLALGWESY